MEDETGLALDFHPFSPPGVDVHAIDGLADEPKLHQVAEHEAAGTEVHEALEKGRDGQNSLARINTTRLLVNLFEQIMATSDPILCAETASNIPQQEATDTGSPLLVPPRLFRLSIVCFEAHALLIACARTRITPPPPAPTYTHQHDDGTEGLVTYKANPRHSGEERPAQVGELPRRPRSTQTQRCGFVRVYIRQGRREAELGGVEQGGG